MEVLEVPTNTKRPKILEEIMGEIDESSRKEDLVKAKRQLEAQVMDALANVRLQESLLEMKEKAFDEAEDDMSDTEEKTRMQSLEQAKLILEDRTQGAVALSEELRRVNSALKEMSEAGLAPFGNRSSRRSKAKK